MQKSALAPLHFSTLLTLLICSVLGALWPPAAPGAPPAALVSVRFSQMAAPASDADRLRTYSTSTVTLRYADGRQREQALSYRVLFNNTDRIGDSAVPAGQLFDMDGKPLQDPNGDPLVAETPDANSLLRIGDALYLITHYEYDWLLEDGQVAYRVPGWYRRMPMSMSLTRLSADAENGQLRAVAQRPIDVSAVHGLWIPCFGSQTPWNTHLGAEEGYEVLSLPATHANGQPAISGLRAMTQLYFNQTRQANPYHYGYITEVKIHPDGGAEVRKHYNLGRASWEVAKVMPDRRTLYFGDDGEQTVLFMYVSDRADDLSAGNLYAARWRQLSDQNGGAAALTWIRLGHASYADIKARIDSGIVFEDLFDRTTPAQTPHWREDGFRAIRTGNRRNEYLRLKPGQQQSAAFVESRRYAAYLGATSEFNKMEGVAVNAKDKTVYVALSYLGNGMRPDSTAPADHIRLEQRKTGAVYAIATRGEQRDSDGQRIASAWVGHTMAALPALLGADIASDAVGNRADPNKLANPDNLFFSEKMRVLFISEDSYLHLNNNLWAYHVDSGELARILSVAAGAESSGLQVIDNLNGHAYVMSNAQHQGDWPASTPAEVRRRLTAQAAATYGRNAKGVPYYYLQAPVGYLDGIPGL
jgi:secreted PhoX family phosphatase